MPKILFSLSAFFLAIISISLSASSQTVFCKKPALAALRPIPELKYQCREMVDDYDTQLLKFPERLKALAQYTKSLENLNDEGWWKTPVDELAACFIRRKAGALSDEEKQQYEDRSAAFNLQGNNRIRLIAAKDPCYQTQFGGSDLFLLMRDGRKTYATEIIDGFYSRADSPVSLQFAANGAETIVEVSTNSGGMGPTTTNYYFTIDKKTGRAVPKNLFREAGHQPTNQITSQMLLEDSRDYGLPPGLEPLLIVEKNKLAGKFDSFNESGVTVGVDGHSKLIRLRWQWNGKYYLSSASN